MAHKYRTWVTDNEEEMVAIARSMLAGEMHPIAGCLAIDGLLVSTYRAPNSKYAIFGQICIAFAWYPHDENDRANWSPEVLPVKDREYRETIVEYEEEIRAACEFLIRKMDKP